MSEFAPPNPAEIVHPADSHSLSSVALKSAETVSTQANENIETLMSKGELGIMLEDLYEAALEVEPALAEVKILGRGSGDEGYEFLKYTGGRARHKGKTDSGQHEVVFNTDDGIEHYQKLLTTRQASMKISAEKVGVEDMTPEMLASFIFLHELGHVVDYIKNAPDITTRNERRKLDMATLPIPGRSPAQLAEQLGGSLDQWFSDNHEELRSKFGIESKEDLMAIQEVAYRKMKTEDIPDQFAASVMRKLGIV